MIKTEVDTLLDAKLNINNPQDISGVLRIGHVLGTSKIILNAVSSDKDVYVNGDAQVNGNHLVASLDSSGYIKVLIFSQIHSMPWIQMIYFFSLIMILIYSMMFLKVK